MLREPARGSGFEAALAAAVRAERAFAARTPCQRVSRLLCELGKSLGCEADLPLSRAVIGKALDLSLVRVKRTLGLLCLSGVLEMRGEGIRVLDWRKLCGAARLDPATLDLANEDEIAPCTNAADEPYRTTAAGDPACFV